MSIFTNLLIYRFKKLLKTIKTDASTGEMAEFCVSTQDAVETFTKAMLDQSTESVNVLVAVIVNSIWIIDQIEHNLGKDIANCDFGRLKAQMQGITSDGFQSFVDVYDYSISMNEEHWEGSDPDPDLDLNDMLLLLTISGSKKLSSMPYTKKAALAAINVPLLFHSIIYISLIIPVDERTSLEEYVQKCLMNRTSDCVYMPCHKQLLSLIDQEDIATSEINLAKKAVNYMVQFIMRITDYRLTYDINPKYFDKCMQDVLELTRNIPDLDYTDSDQSSVHSTPFNSPFLFPPMPHVMGSLGTFELETIDKSKNNKHPRLRY